MPSRQHAPLAISLVALVGGVSAAYAQDYYPRCPLKDVVPSLTVTGTATAEVAPSVATISLAVVTERPKATDATRDNALAAQAVVAEIKAQGTDPRDIRTSALSLTPVYEEERDQESGQSRRVFRGYAARNAVTVRLRQLDKAGALVARLIEAGANRVESVVFDYEQKEVRLEALRGEAVRDALRKATSYVSGLGIKLGRVLVIAPPPREARPPGPLAMAREAPRDENAPIALEPGVQTLQASVEVTWELAQ